MFSFARTTWRTGHFKLHVDIEKSGLRYDIEELAERYRGCLIEGELYNPMSEWRYKDVLTELKKFVAYAPKPVYVNGELYGGPAGRLKSWTHEDEDAWYRVMPEATELLVYNQGVFVEGMSTWRTGMGGIIVSKKPLEVNFARNSVLEDRCQVWGRIAKSLESTAISKLSSAKQLTDAERKYLARRVGRLAQVQPDAARKAKVLTDPTGRHFALRELRSFKTFVHVEEVSPAACAAHGNDGLFVVTTALLERFGASSVGEWLRSLESLGDLVNPDYEVIEPKALREYCTGAGEVLAMEGLKVREQAALAALDELNRRLAEKLVAAGLASHRRSLLVGRHRQSAFVAWTDGKEYVTANRRYLKRLEEGLDGVHWWLLTLVHEYMHDTDDSESHSHGEVFYRKFHDAVCDAPLALGKLAKEGLEVYLRELKARGVVRRRELSRQLKSG